MKDYSKIYPHEILHNARKGFSTDEWYTRYEDVGKIVESIQDTNYFRGKIVLMPCDNPLKSNFYKYFVDNFEKLGLKRIVASCYAENPLGDFTSFIADDSANHGKYYIYEGGGESKYPSLNELKTFSLDGSFLSQEVTALRNTCDVIITNPPFSLKKEFFYWCLESGKDFHWVAPLLFFKNTYFTEWLMKNPGKFFQGVYIREFDNGKSIRKGSNRSSSISFGNIPTKGFPPFELVDGGQKIFLDYPNDDILFLDEGKNFPKNYYGLARVPYTFIGYVNRDQFDIICTNLNIEKVLGRKYSRNFTLNGKPKFGGFVVRLKK